MLSVISVTIRIVFAYSTLVMVLAAPALATPVNVVSANSGNCDALAVPSSLHELGLGPASGGPFPFNEEILASDAPTGFGTCSSVVNTLITMTNMSGTDWTNVWYVADPETTVSNFDGLVNGELAFKIDSVGANAPLVFESLVADGIFQAGEVWEFILGDFFNTFGLTASELGSCTGGLPCSVGLVGGASVGDSISTGSIIVANVPEASTALLLGSGLLGLAARRRFGRG